MLKSGIIDYIKFGVYSLRIYYSEGDKNIAVKPLVDYKIFDIFYELLNTTEDNSLKVTYFKS
jgi:hypothetical protein